MLRKVALVVALGSAPFAVSWSAGLAAAEPQSPAATVATQTAAPTAPSDALAPRALLNRYCVTCHNERLKTAGLMLDKADVDHLDAAPEIWEKVRRKIRGGAMPPVGRPRPPAEVANTFASWIEMSLDTAAEAHPNPGRTTVHRLNRTEYQNAIRDLLSLEVNAASLLPADDAAFGFDNIAELLKVSPDLLDGYLSAANKLTRIAVGDTALSLGSATYAVSTRSLQADRAGEDLPFGSRGGTAVTHYFPFDGEYVVKISANGVSRSNPVEIRIDGAKVAALPSPSRPENTADEAAGMGAAAPLEVRIPVKAGPRVVGVSFPNRLVEAESRFPKFYPWGNSATFSTNVGVVNYSKIDAVDITGPFNPQGPGDTPSRRKIFVCRPAGASSEDACAQKIFTTLARQAYRRPVTPADVKPLLTIYKQARATDSFEASIQAGLERMFVDPGFLFRAERQPAGVAGGSTYRVGALDLASRLSFFLWSTIPDEELLQSAAQGKLNQPAELERQVRRMLQDPRAKALIDNFAAEWLYLRNVMGATPDSFEFPDWDDDLRAAMATETKLFVEDQFRTDRSVAELLSANYTFMNERLAAHYGIEGVHGSRFRRVTFPDNRRAGLLGHASILMVTSQPNRTSPVMRGKWLLENLLGAPPPPPPPDVPDLPKNDPSQQPKSIRERMEQHRKNAVCASCHAVMDPLGFSLENYDAIGTWRVVADGQPVDASGVLPDGTKFNGPAGLREIFHSRKDDFVGAFTEKLLTYALGRGLEVYDMPTVRKILKNSAAADYRWSAIILEITKSVPFQMRIAGNQS